MEQYVEVLLASRRFAGVRRAELEAMLVCLGGRVARYARDGEILGAGERTRCLGLVLSGTVYVLREDFWGNRNILTAAGPGEVFGESYACLPEEAIPIRAVAAESAEVLLLEVRRVLTTCPSACAFHALLIRNLLEVLAVKNLTMNEKLIHLTQRTTRDKLLSYLSVCSARAGEPEFEIPYNRQQLADYLSVDRSAMSAELSRLRAQGILVCKKNRFRLLGRPET